MINLISKTIDGYFESIYQEATKNPFKTVDGHIQNEIGVTTDYRGRAIYEFFQNSIDRAQKKIWIKLDRREKRLIIANDGQAFTLERLEHQKYSDFESLCSINTSSKNQNESIGNKGVGFKSCWEYTQHVVVCSRHMGEAWGFEFFNPLSKEKLESFDIPKITGWLQTDEISDVVNKHGRVPSFYFPKRIDNEAEYFSLFDKGENPVTIIVFHLDNLRKEEDLVERINEFVHHQIFFVKQLKALADKNIELEFSFDGEVKQRLFSHHNINDWLIIAEDFSDLPEVLAELVSLSDAASYRVDQPRVAVAFPLTDTLIDTKFYCYLPTEVECGFNVLIHADFLLDRSRKQIDFSIPYNKRLLEHAAELFVKNLLEQDQLHQLEHFVKFLSPKKGNSAYAKELHMEFKPFVWSALTKEASSEDEHETCLTVMLKRVFIKDMLYPLKVYEQIFEVIKEWIPPRDPGGEYSKYYKKLYDDIIKNFCHIDVHIVPISTNEKVFKAVSLPKKKTGQTYEHSLFYAPYRQDRMHYDLSLISDIPQLDISYFEPLNEPYFLGQENKLVRELDAKVDFLRTLVSNIDTYTEENIKEKVLYFSYQFAVDVDKDDRNFTQFLETSKRSNSAKYQLTMMLVPCIGNAQCWHTASKSYFGLDPSVSESLKNNGFKEVDLKKCSSIFGCGDHELRKVLLAFGVWDVVPLNNDMSLPWNDLESLDIDMLEVVKSEINRAIPVWTKIDGYENVQTTLKETRWYVDHIKSECVYTPMEVFLFNDRIKRDFIGQATKDSILEPLYTFLGIRMIEDTQDTEKLMKQLKAMKDRRYDITESHKTAYRQLTLVLSKYYKEFNGELIIPILVESEGTNIYLDNGRAWFVPQEHKNYKHYFHNYNYVIFDNDIARQFIRSIGVEVFDPEYELQYSGEKVLQSELKGSIQNDFLPVFLAIAEEVRGGALEKEAVLSRWNSLRIMYANDVFLKIKIGNDVVKPFEHEKDKDVLYLPLTKTDREKKEIVSEIAHDLLEPLDNPNFSGFGYAVAEGVFRFSSLGPLFSEYISKWQLEKNSEYQLCENFLKSLGINKSARENAERFVREMTLKPEDMNVLLGQLRMITKCEDINHENWYSPNTYTHSVCTYTKLEQGVDEKYKDIVKQISPFNKNRGLLEKALIKQEVYLQALMYLQNGKNVERALKIFDDKKHKMLNASNDSLQAFDFDLDVYLSAEFNHDVYKADKNAIENAEVDITFRINDEDMVASQTQIKGVKQALKTFIGKSSASVCHFSTEDMYKTIDRQKRQGEAREVKLCLKHATEMLKWSRNDIKMCFEKIKTAIEVDIDLSKQENRALFGIYKNRLDAFLAEEQLTVSHLTELLQVSKVIGDGLGYDILEPQNDKDGFVILKIEVKSSSRKRIYLSQNELERIIYFTDNNNEPNWRMYLGEADVTNYVKEAVEQLITYQKFIQKENIGHSFFHSDWILEFE